MLKPFLNDPLEGMRKSVVFHQIFVRSYHVSCCNVTAYSQRRDHFQKMYPAESMLPCNYRDTNYCYNSLHFFLLGLLLCQILLDTVVQDGPHTKGPVLLDQRSDGVVVFPGHKLTVEGHLHHLLECPLTKQLLRQLHQLKAKQKVTWLKLLTNTRNNFWAHLFILLDEDIDGTQPEDKQAPKQLDVSFASVGFLCVVEVHLDLTRARLWGFVVADELNRLRFHYGAVQLTFLFLAFGGCHRRPVPSGRSENFVDTGRVRLRKSGN